MIGYVTLAGMAGSLVLGLAALVRGPRRLAQMTFTAGMLAFAVESGLIYGLLFYSSTPASHARWLASIRMFALLLPIPWALFTFVSFRRADAVIPWAWRVSFAAGGLGLALSAAVGLLRPFLLFPDLDGPFRYAVLTSAGQAAVIVEILATIAVLYGLEPSIRNTYGSTRWRLKYLALGLGGIFAVRFYLLSQLLLFRVLTPESLAIGSVTLAVGLAIVPIGLVRSGGLRADLSVSRHFVYRSIVVSICGLYLLLAGLSGWLLNTLGIPDKAFWGSLVVFLSVLGLAALLLSESLRWRVRRYISTHFYASKYDYRQQWRSLTDSLATRVTVEGIGAQLLRTVIATVGAARVVLYLTDKVDGTLQLMGALGTGRFPKTVELQWEHFVKHRTAPEALPVATLGARDGDSLVAGGLLVAVPLPSRGQLLGVLLVGPERTDAAYTQEDLDVLTTIGEQGASAVATARLSEQLAESRAFDAFSRLSSFVIHDLKNSISALSLLSQNAAQHFDDPRFRADALRTLERTVGRMQGLLGRLSGRQAADPLALEEVALDDLVRDTVEAQLGGGRVAPELDLAPVPAVRADADAIQRVLQNIVQNAVEAMEGEGRLTVRTFHRDGLVGCAVTDTGCGMSEQFVRRSLFVPFQTTKKGGWGIGLYQAREIVAAHGGRVEVQSQEGRGTTITLLLPEAAR